ncbi:MAG: hypothetical protein AABY22_05005, partial [Nanoarchaeota archaeon]
KKQGQAFNPTLTPKAICSNRGASEIINDNTCKSYSACDSGCCNIGDEKRYISEIECKNLADKSFGSEYDFNNIFQRISINQCYQNNEDEGCCLQNNGFCNYGKKLSCNGNFNSGKICSQLNECSNCKSKFYKECYKGGIYWFDSCSNKEELVQRCNLENELCSKEEGKEPFCKSLDCAETTKFEGWDYTGGPRKHGESWCVYEGPTGNFLDRPGSRHFKFGCLNGEEKLIQDCGDYRNQICVQTNFNNSEFSQAGCIDNNVYSSPITTEISTVPIGFKYWEDNVDRKNQCKKGTTRCPVAYVKKDRISEWGCEGNCFCESQEFIDQAKEIEKKYANKF